jgi:hypothetical protein
MARKRMLSPEIWESESFSSLSDTAKIVFISLISHADDEGRGKANAGFVKSMTFPYDEGKRITDITKALNEIAQLMSVRFYKYDGSEYYCLTKWSVWQKIDKPSKSKIPPPTTETDRGVGELLPESGKNEKFDEHSANTSRILDEASTTKKNRIRKEYNITTTNVVAENGLTTDQYSSLCAEIGKADCDYYILRVKAFLKKYPSANFDAYSTILKWHREDKKKTDASKVEKTYSSEQLNAMFDNLSYEDL